MIEHLKQFISNGKDLVPVNPFELFEGDGNSYPAEYWGDISDTNENHYDFNEWAEPIKIKHDDSIKEGEVVGVEELEFEYNEKAHRIGWCILYIEELHAYCRMGEQIRASRKPVKVEEEISDVWISVEDRLPEEHTDVLVYYYGNRNSKDFPYCQYMKESSFYNNRFECEEEVTHWMPLPNPPKNQQSK